MGSKKMEIQKEVTSAEAWDEYESFDGLLVVDVHASWCGPCKVMQNVFKKFYFEYPDHPIMYLTADVAVVPQLQKYKPPSKCKPTFLLRDNNDLEEVIEGADQPKVEEAINDWINSHNEDAEEDEG